jgi:hypothetical protein
MDGAVAVAVAVAVVNLLGKGRKTSRGNRRGAWG